MRKVLSFLLCFVMVFQLASCSTGGEPGTSAVTGSSEESDIVIPDTTSSADGSEADPADSVYYNSKSVMFDQQVDHFVVTRNGDGYLVLAEKWGWDDQNKQLTDVRGYIIGEDYSVKTSFDLGMEYIPEGACMIDDKTFAVTGGKGEEYRIYDLTGKLIKTGPDEHGLCRPREDDVNFDEPQQICAVSDGFVVATCHTAVKFGKDGSYIAGVSYNEDNIESFNSLFVQDGKAYICTENMDDGSNSFDLLDFDKGSCEKVLDPGRDLDRRMTGPDLEDNTFYGTETDKNYIVKADIAGRKVVNVAAFSNILKCPSTYDSSSLNEWIYCLDDDHFYTPYCYIEEAAAEIVFIYKDPDLDLGGRKVITIQGMGTESDRILKTSAYYYNNMQKDYFIKTIDLSDKISYASTSDTARSIAGISAEFMKGNAPDIFYGNTFDYDYWGRNNVVIDMKPYLEKNGTFREGDITPSVLRLMEDGSGHIYQTFAGYNLFGFWGRDKDFGKDSYSISDLKPGTTLFGGLEARDICYYTLGANLKEMYQSGELTKENVKAIVDLAVASGTPPVDDPGSQQPVTASAVGKGKAKLFVTGVSNAVKYNSLANDFKGTPVFAGYPSVSGSSHMIEPSVCLMAVSSSASDPQGCCDFISFFYSVEMQRRIMASGSVPVNNAVWEEYLGYLGNPDSMTEEMKKQYQNILVRKNEEDSGAVAVPMSQDLIDAYRAQVAKADAVSVFDWGVYDIIVQEMNSYYAQGKSADDVADSLCSRLELYAKENY